MEIGLERKGRQEESVVALIYAVEDDKNILEIEMFALKNSGYQVDGFECARDFYKKLDEKQPDLILLDVMLPDEDGLEIVAKLRRRPETKKIPVIMVTAKTTEIDKVKGLDAGADDYLTKPFGVMELIARIKAVLRRSNKIMPAAATDSSDLSAGNGLLKLNYDFHKVYVNDDEVTLTLKEFELLYYLLKNKNIVISRDKIMDEVWDYNYAAETRTVDVHIKTLRHKLGPASKLIETIRGVGYKIVD